MAGRAAFGKDHYEDIRALLRRGMSKDEAAAELGMSRATLYRILNRYGGSTTT